MQVLNNRYKYLGVLPSSGEGGTSDPKAKYLGTVTNGGSFPSQRSDGSGLVDGDYVKPSSTSTFPFTINGVTFTNKQDKAIYVKSSNSWILDPGSVQDTDEIPVADKITESLSKTATTQQLVNREFVDSFKGKKFEFTNSKVWNISHLLDRKPIIRCFDTNDKEIYGSISYPTSNNAVVNFGINTSGYVLVN